jgi:hypothetical protein
VRFAKQLVKQGTLLGSVRVALKCKEKFADSLSVFGLLFLKGGQYLGHYFNVGQHYRNLKNMWRRDSNTSSQQNSYKR